MNISRYLSLTLTLFPTLLPLATSEEIFSIHGSGTTNPSKCFWNIMSKIQDRSKAFTRLTYRAVGSGTGQTEFIGTGTTDGLSVPVNDFGSGDIPLSQAAYDGLKKDGASTVVHLPFVVSGVSFFHSVPGVPQGKEGLNLTSCLLAQIFNGKINTWEDERIVEKNPNLPGMLGLMNGDSLPIKVAHRWEGSSSTKSITEYLHLKCPTEWPSDMVNKLGKSINWAPGSLKNCDGSGPMTDCIRENEGTIGYIDAGHGWEEGLTEIELENHDGFYVSSYDSFNSGGTGVAATKATFDITEFDESFATVHLLDQAGEKTWPILVMSYIYVRTNIKDYITEKGRLGLLSIFLKAMYEPEYIDECQNYGFTPVPADVREKAINTLNDKVDFDGVADEWTFEDGIQKIDGQGDKVISPKRRAFAEYERSTIAAGLESVGGGGQQYETLVETVRELVKLNEVKEEKIMKLEKEFSELEKDTDDHGHPTASVLSIISFVLWCLAIGYLVVTKVFLKDESPAGHAMNKEQDIA